VTAEEPLDTLAIRHGADKSSKVHGYTLAYERFLAPLRNQPIVLLEIGVGTGASLRTWREYFPEAALVGLDVKDCRNVVIPGTTFYQGSQSDESLLEQLIARSGPFDVVIDDGSHFWADQIASFRKLYPHVKPGGAYVVEDLHTSYTDEFKLGSERTVDFLRDLVNEVNIHGRCGYGILKNDPAYESFAPDLNVYQRTIESITFFKSIVFVRKKGTDQI
jgi:hypothetical protein